MPLKSVEVFVLVVVILVKFKVCAAPSCLLRLCTDSPQTRVELTHQGWVFLPCFSVSFLSLSIALAA